MREKFDIVVVGGGISGCALFYELSRSGMGKVALLEAGEIASKITGDSGGYIRKFNTDPYLAQLASESFDYYQNFEFEVGGSCDFRKTGLVSRVTADAFEGLKTQIEMLRISGHEIFASSTAPTESLRKAHYGDDGHIFIYEPTLGNINTKLACRSWVNAAVRNGGAIFENTKLDEISLRSNGSVASLRTSRGIIESEVVVMSAGAWSKELLRSLPIDLSSISARSFQYNI
ncbi:MAG: FAD-binding oxidoreductase [Candidatus Obscuribacterales bacterium]|nr:FAD-binding oxidoreductase [Candidatus Obscuribacterales bacterium]